MAGLPAATHARPSTQEELGVVQGVAGGICSGAGRFGWDEWVGTVDGGQGEAARASDSAGPRVPTKCLRPPHLSTYHHPCIENGAATHKHVQYSPLDLPRCPQQG